MSSKAQQALGGLPYGLLFVVSAPAGTGKNTLLNRLMSEFPVIRESISCTTRPPRPGEVQGREYHFLTEDEFSAKIAAGDFLEHVRLYDHAYGTLRSTVEQQRNAGFHVVLVIDTQGALKLMESVEATYIFIRPPSLAELRRRLEARSTEKGEALEHRLSEAVRELSAAIHYDYQIINDDLDVATEVMRSIFIAEEHRMRPTSKHL